MHKDTRLQPIRVGWASFNGTHRPPLTPPPRCRVIHGRHSRLLSALLLASLRHSDTQPQTSGKHRGQRLTGRRQTAAQGDLSQPLTESCWWMGKIILKWEKQKGAWAGFMLIFKGSSRASKSGLNKVGLSQRWPAGAAAGQRVYCCLCCCCCCCIDRPA